MSNLVAIVSIIAIMALGVVLVFLDDQKQSTEQFNANCIGHYELEGEVLPQCGGPVWEYVKNSKYIKKENDDNVLY